MPVRRFDLDGASVADLVTYFSKASRGLSWQEAKSIHKLCEVGRKCVEDNVAKVVARAQGDPVLISQSADGTPIQICNSSRETLPTGTRVSRSGKCTFEFLAAAQFARSADASGCLQTAVDIRGPQLLVLNGKKAPQIFEACRKIWRVVHGTAASIGRLYLEYEVQMAMSRTMALYFCKIWLKEGDCKEVVGLQRWLARSDKKAPDKLKGRQAYAGDLLAKVSSTIKLAQHPDGARQAVMASHGRSWEDKSAAFKERYRRIAVVRASRQRQQLFAKRVSVQRKLAAERAKARERMASRKPLFLSNAALTEEAVSRMQAEFDLLYWRN